MRAVLLIGLCSSWLSCTAQTASLPTWVIDSLIYETTKGRQCSVVMEAQQNEIEALGKELLHTGEALKLSQSESKTLTGLLSNSKEQGRVDKMQADLNKKVLKDKVKKRTILIIGETILIVILLL